MTCRTKGMLWKGVMFAPEYLTEQLKTPYEVEAYGKERGLLVSFFIKWKEIEEVMGMKYSLNKEK